MTSAASASDTATAVKCDLAGEVLHSFGSLRFAATGWSMLPAVWPGDTLMVDRIAPEQVRVGDVVLVGRDGRLCAHRVISVAAGSGKRVWITRGDAMSVPDRAVLETELLGRVAYLIRAGRLVALPGERSAMQRLTARILQGSMPAARVLVYLHRRVQTPPKSAAEESVLTCQG